MDRCRVSICAYCAWLLILLHVDSVLYCTAALGKEPPWMKHDLAQSSIRC